jgi:hypothetical protein
MTSTIPRTETPSSSRPFLPEFPVEGYRGFYPVDPSDYARMVGQRIPLPLLHASRLERVKAIRCQLSFNATRLGPGTGTVFHSFTADLTPSQALCHLFYSDGVSLEHLQVVWDDGSTSWASWRQDRSTGSYAIVVGSSQTPVVIQGGYLGHMPRSVKWLDKSQFGQDWNDWAIVSDREARKFQRHGQDWFSFGLR